MSQQVTQPVVGPEVEVRRSRRRTRTVSAYRQDGKVIVLIPARFSRAEEAEWVQTMVARLDGSAAAGAPTPTSSAAPPGWRRPTTCRSRPPCAG